MTKQEFVAIVNTWTKWKVDKFGHYHQVSEKTGKHYRLKLSRVSVRYEIQSNHEATGYSPASKSWVRISSAYYSALKQLIDGRIIGFKY